MCVSVCFMQMWARGDVNCTQLGDTGEGGEQREGQALPTPPQETEPLGILRGWSVDLSPLFYSGPEAGTWHQWTCL